MSITIRYFFIISIILISRNLWSQEKKYEIRFQLESSHSTIENSILKQTILPTFSLNYQLKNWLDIGALIGYTPLLNHINSSYNPDLSPYKFIDGSSSIVYNHSTALLYGINSSVHIMPLFNANKLKFDLYLIPSLYMMSEQYEDLGDNYNKIWSKPYFNYGLGAGFKYSFSTKFNLFAEYSLGSYFKGENNKLRFGMGFRF